MHRTLVMSGALAALLALAAPAAAAAPESERSAAAAEPQPMKDAFLKGRIVSAYAVNPHVSAFDLDVRVEQGVAHLSGTVDSPIQRDIAVEIARGVEDVRAVRSSIAVKPGAREARDSGRTPGQKIDDATLTAAVKAKLLANENTGGLGINVTTHQGVVTLTGRVESEAEKDLAGRIAGNSANVKAVRNELVVRGTS